MCDTYMHCTPHTCCLYHAYIRPRTHPPTHPRQHTHTHFTHTTPGRGSYGTVYKALDTESNRTVALKNIPLDDGDNDISMIEEEISLLQSCDHPNIVKYLVSGVGGGYAVVWYVDCVCMCVQVPT